MKRVIGIGGIFFKAKDPKHCGRGITNILVWSLTITAA